MPGPAVVDWAIYGATYWTSFVGFTFGWGLRATGRHNLPLSGPVLIVSNHQSFLDPVLLGASANRRLTYLARSTLFQNPALGRVISHFGAVPIDRGFGKAGLQTVLGELDRGNAVVMFPEGERTHTGELQPLKPGVSLLLKRVKCPIVPAAVAGVYEAWPRQRKWPTPAPLGLLDEGRSIGVAFGKPFLATRWQKADRDVMLTDVQEEIRIAFGEADRIRCKSR